MAINRTPNMSVKKIIPLLLGFLLIALASSAQHGFGIEYIGGGPMHTIDLSNANKTFVGNTMSSFGAADFGANDVLYGINSGTNQFYEIDTIDGTTTLIGSIIPPANHLWTGMAYDEGTGIMYGYSSYGIAAGECSLHIIDVSDASLTLVGTQSTATAIGCIAIDGNGQMYGMNLQASAKIYLIDKTNNAVTLLGNTGQGAAGMGHGMDFCNADQTMYMTTYNSMTFANTLRIVNLTTGNTTQVGGLLGVWTSAFAIPGSLPLSADFTSDVTDICINETVNYTDLSTSATSWLWTFEGGTPATSTDQNPTVTYTSIGAFDVSLEVSNGTSTDLKSVTEYITVTDTPSQPDTPTGEINTCGNEEYTYTTNPVIGANTYLWEVTPADAGIISGNSTSGVFNSAGDWSGSYTIKVSATNECGISIWSQELTCELNFTPTTFFLNGGGSFCEGSGGLELSLDGSEFDVNYELFLDGNTTGLVIAGTGSALSFGYHSIGGLYTVWGDGGSCSTLMFGEAYISIDYLPGAGSQPSGNSEVCAGETEDYQTNPIPGADSLIWTIDPVEAGTFLGSGENIQVEWSMDFYGIASLSVYGVNDCGNGAISDIFEVIIDECTDVMDMLHPKLSVYPNPSNNHLTIFIDHKTVINYDLTIRNQIGHVIYSDRIKVGESGLYYMDVSGFSAGVYFLSITNNKHKAFTTRFEVVR